MRAGGRELGVSLSINFSDAERRTAKAPSLLEIAGDRQQSPGLVWAHHLRDLLWLTKVIDLGSRSFAMTNASILTAR